MARWVPSKTKKKLNPKTKNTQNLNEELSQKLRMARMGIFWNKAEEEEELIWMLLLHTQKKKTSLRTEKTKIKSRQKPNQENLI